jgi:hypothetical protein
MAKQCSLCRTVEHMALVLNVFGVSENGQEPRGQGSVKKVSRGGQMAQRSGLLLLMLLAFFLCRNVIWWASLCLSLVWWTP